MFSAQTMAGSEVWGIETRKSNYSLSVRDKPWICDHVKMIVWPHGKRRDKSTPLPIPYLIRCVTTRIFAFSNAIPFNAGQGSPMNSSLTLTYGSCRDQRTRTSDIPLWSDGRVGLTRGTWCSEILLPENYWSLSSQMPVWKTNEIEASTTAERRLELWTNETPFFASPEALALPCLEGKARGIELEPHSTGVRRPDLNGSGPFDIPWVHACTLPLCRRCISIWTAN